MNPRGLSLDSVGADQEAALGFTGGPLELFETVGRDAFVTLLLNGLLPAHRVLDFGCGSLRLGYWLIRFLDAGCYFGIEPREEAVQVGEQTCVGAQLLELKQPRFDYNAGCDMRVFGETFDFVVARSVLTHLGPFQLRRILE